ncbi:MAG: ATP-binding protein [Acidobacteria bacterium]|nr:ATP-binding protein [Acidobacteriota bacterium]
MASIFSFVEEFFVHEDLVREKMNLLCLVVEDLFTNMVKYNKGSPSEIRLRLQHDAGRLNVRLTDFGVASFDITVVAKPITDLPLEQRRVSGLGLHLTRQIVYDLRYDYRNGDAHVSFSMPLR